MSLDKEEILRELMAFPVETEWLEFKEAKESFDFDKLGKYFSALSNEANLKNKDCGWLVLGVSDRPPRQISSTSYKSDVRSLDELKKSVTEHLRPRLSFNEIYELNLPEGRVLMFEIPPARRGHPTSWKGHYYGRDGEALGALNSNEYEQVQSQSAREDWSARICENASISDLDKEAISFAREQYKEKHPALAQEVDRWDNLTFLNKAKVLVDGKITTTSLILLGKSEAHHYLSPSVAKITWVLKDSNGLEKDYEHFEPPLILAVDQIYSRIRNLTYRYLPDQSLFPTEVSQYEPWVLREVLHNCIAHQDYSQAGRLNVVEETDSLLFSNLGSFLPGSIEEVINKDSPPEYYRNSFLVGAMVNLNMIDTIGSGIKRMYTVQRNRFFPMPDYDLSDATKVHVRLFGKVLDKNYTRILVSNSDLGLNDVIALDKVQKKQELTESEFKLLKSKKLIEGRRPNLFVSSQIAAQAGKKADYIKNRAFDKEHYKKLVLSYLKEYDSANREDIEKLLLSKISDALTMKQKKNHIKNLTQEMRKEEKIFSKGTGKASRWYLSKKDNETIV